MEESTAPGPMWSLQVNRDIFFHVSFNQDYQSLAIHPCLSNDEETSNNV